MEVLIVIALIVYFLLKNMAKQSAKEKKERAGAQRPRPAAPSAPPRESEPRMSGGTERAPMHAARAQKRVQMAQPEVWRAAKRQQDDAEQLHSIKMDSCESKLESLRTLYEAGILDREEYAERVARTKAKHFHQEA